MSDDIDDKYDNISVQMTLRDFNIAFGLISIPTFESALWMKEYHYEKVYFNSKIRQCHIFNMKEHSKILKFDIYKTRIQAYGSLDFLWEKKIPKDYPVKTVGKDLGLDLHIYEGDNRWRETPKTYNIGFEITIHSPDEFIDDDSFFHHVDLNNSYLVYIRPAMSKIHESLHNLTPEK